MPPPASRQSASKGAARRVVSHAQPDRRAGRPVFHDRRAAARKRVDLVIKAVHVECRAAFNDHVGVRAQGVFRPGLEPAGSISAPVDPSVRNCGPRRGFPDLEDAGGTKAYLAFRQGPLEPRHAVGCHPVVRKIQVPKLAEPLKPVETGVRHLGLPKNHCPKASKPFKVVQARVRHPAVVEAQPRKVRQPPYAIQARVRDAAIGEV